MKKKDTEGQLYIPSFSYCRKIAVQSNGKAKLVDVTQPYSVLSPVAVPGNFSFMVAFAIGGLVPNKDYSFDIIFADPFDNVITRYPLKVAPIKMDSNNNGYSIQASIDFVNLILPVEGIYKTIVKYNDTVLGSFSILVHPKGIKNA